MAPKIPTDDGEHRLVVVRRSVDGHEIEYADLVHNERWAAYKATERMAPGEIISMKTRPIRLRQRWWERHPHRGPGDDVNASPAVIEASAEEGFDTVVSGDGTI